MGERSRVCKLRFAIKLLQIDELLLEELRAGDLYYRRMEVLSVLPPVGRILDSTSASASNIFIAHSLTMFSKNITIGEFGHS